MHARGESGELYPELSTAASRWRPRAALGGMAKGGGTSASQGGRWGAAGRRVARASRRRWPPGRSTVVGAAPLSAGGVEQRASRLEEGDKDRFAISINSRD